MFKPDNSNVDLFSLLDSIRLDGLQKSAAAGDVTQRPDVHRLADELKLSVQRSAKSILKVLQDGQIGAVNMNIQPVCFSKRAHSHCNAPFAVEVAGEVFKAWGIMELHRKVPFRCHALGCSQHRRGITIGLNVHGNRVHGAWVPELCHRNVALLYYTSVFVAIGSIKMAARV
jgi:hypothetical protein